MPYVSFIDDNTFENIVSDTINVASNAMSNSKKKFEKNVIDPFLTIFEISGFRIDSTEWLEHEKWRQAQKSLSNSIGIFHQKLLGSINGWECLPTGHIVDIVNHEKRIIAEIKNKYNTIKGSAKAKLYHDLDDLVMQKKQEYKEYTAYYVEIIPKKPERYNQPFTPSDSRKGAKCAANEKIRVIDGYSFYSLASGIQNALEAIYQALPLVIQKILPDINLAELHSVMKYFNQAFGSK
ncbi:Eco47II restriction endonuclease [Legionella pneumophila]|nr:Eco47II family restriction endonuclease [Legionella pneumophila]AGN14133.1 type II restriction enzyme (Eco47II, Sau96I) [Legionella pneumophila subsp. pneumophila str. Thunder Bay]OOK39899.1 type II restriction enzyme (Eco47II, Sau96I) [Legionella pneumophila subsp. pneumophila str. Sudbury]AOU10264.1 restriction endonuclease [Legionella pneumophila]AOU13182.1 restriction endonuclease [Legionella pneumophila]AOU16188.1 restriction endonuclease [Legionella pneumophila]